MTAVRVKEDIDRILAIFMGSDSVRSNALVQQVSRENLTSSKLDEQIS